MPAGGSFSDTVKQQADIVRVVGDYVKLKKTGAQNFTGLCPFHKEKTASFPCMPRGSSITASVAAPRETFLASYRSWTTSPFRKQCGPWRRS